MLKLGDRLRMDTGRHFASFNACPQTGTIIYISDFIDNVIDIYAGPNFAGQAPCGKLSGSGLSNPQGMTVKAGDLYVANTGGFDVLVFHRGATSPFKTYTDPGDGGGQYPVDVTVAADKTVIASNNYAPDNYENGSISTWHKNGTLVGNFPMVNDISGLFLTLTKSGTLFFNDRDNSGYGYLWRGSCPAGVCGTFSYVGPQANTIGPGGLRVTENDTHLIQIDESSNVGGELINYVFRENFSHTSCGFPNEREAVSEDINFSEHHLFWAGATIDYVGLGGEMTYPGCVLIGTVPTDVDGEPIGVAVDRPGPLD